MKWYIVISFFILIIAIIIEYVKCETSHQNFDNSISPSFSSTITEQPDSIITTLPSDEDYLISECYTRFGENDNLNPYPIPDEILRKGHFIPFKYLSELCRVSNSKIYDEDLRFPKRTIP